MEGLEGCGVCAEVRRASGEAAGGGGTSHISFFESVILKGVERNWVVVKWSGVKREVVMTRLKLLFTRRRSRVSKLEFPIEEPIDMRRGNSELRIMQSYSKCIWDSIEWGGILIGGFF